MSEENKDILNKNEKKEKRLLCKTQGRTCKD